MNEDKKLESMISMLYFQSEVETDNEDAEKFTAYALNTPDKPYMKESVTLYGLQDDSRYIPIDFRDDGVYISSAYAEKYLLEPATRSLCTRSMVPTHIPSGWMASTITRAA